MRIQYRTTSGVALGALALAVVTEYLPPLPPKTHPTPTKTGVVGWDPCTMWVQTGAIERLAAFVFFGAFLVFTVQGLRNRSAPRWLGISGLAALGLIVKSGFWRVTGGCYTMPGLIGWFTWVAAVSLMFLHHILQRPTRSFPAKG